MTRDDFYSASERALIEQKENDLRSLWEAIECLLLEFPEPRDAADIELMDARGWRILSDELCHQHNELARLSGWPIPHPDVDFESGLKMRAAAHAAAVRAAAAAAAEAAAAEAAAARPVINVNITMPEPGPVERDTHFLLGEDGRIVGKHETETPLPAPTAAAAPPRRPRHPKAAG